jgi:ABC-type nitrate/sulfonate/bicarbonate transport system substrate-binding protein
MRAGSMPRRFHASVALAAALVGACACPSRERERLTVGAVALPGPGLFFIADAQGYFAARGLQVIQRRFSSGRDALAALGRGEVDAAIAFETPVVLSASEDPDADVLTTLHTSTRSTRIVARADRGVLRDADLVGKRVGVPRNTNAESFLHAILQYAGVSPGSVHLVDVAPEESAERLAAGELDAVAIWPPHAERARRLLGEENAVEIATDVYTETSMVVTREPVLFRRRAALVKLVRALADAEALVRERPEQAFEALARALPDVPRPDLREAWGRVRPTLGISHLLAHVLENEWRWLRDEGRLTGPLDLRSLLDADVLAEVDPEAVTFVLPQQQPPAERR